METKTIEEVSDFDERTAEHENELTAAIMQIQKNQVELHEQLQRIAECIQFPMREINAGTPLNHHDLLQRAYALIAKKPRISEVEGDGGVPPNDYRVVVDEWIAEYETANPKSKTGENND